MRDDTAPFIRVAASSFCLGAGAPRCYRSVMENEAECRAAGLDPEQVRRIATRIERAALDAAKLGLTVFGGSCGSLRFDDGARAPLIVATMRGNWSGGDGGEIYDCEGLARGE